jgi:hypothetical protein
MAKAQEAVADFFKEALPLDLANSVHFANMLRAVGEAGATFVSVKRTALSTTHLQQSRERTEQKVAEILKAGEQFGYTVSSDGWTDAARSCALICCVDMFSRVAPSMHTFLHQVHRSPLQDKLLTHVLTLVYARTTYMSCLPLIRFASTWAMFMTRGLHVGH